MEPVSLQIGVKPLLHYIHVARSLCNHHSSLTLRGEGAYTEKAFVVARLLDAHTGFTQTGTVRNYPPNSTPALCVEIEVKVIKPPPIQYRYARPFYVPPDEEEEEDRLDEVYDALMQKQLALHGAAREPEFSRRGWGALRPLARSTLFRILKFLPPPTLCTVACLSRIALLLAEEEGLWRDIVKRVIMGNLRFMGTWKRSFLRYMRTHQIESDDSDAEDLVGWQYVGTLPPNSWQRYSVEEYEAMEAVLPCKHKEWLHTRVDLAPFRNVDRNHIDRVDARGMTVEWFQQHYEGPRIPVILTHAMDLWPNLTQWTPQHLSHRLGRVKCKTGKGMKMTLDRYLHYLDTQEEGRPFYLFDDDLFDKHPDLVGEYLPHLHPAFETDFLNLVEGDERPPYRWLVIGGARTGAAFHCDPWQTSAWNALVSGQKRWTLFPPGITPPGVDGTDDDYDDDYASPKPLEWHLEEAPFLPTQLRPLECVQEPGEIIFIPSGWWHMVLNLNLTICCTQNYINRFNVHDCARDMARHPKKWTKQFRTSLAAQHPDLFEDGTLKECFGSA
eukprot:NODE_879_length_1795_cov_21.205036_g823_i0.p1 GENE.NODE_879_length_1795_cov_21.205036_g823_i0~~NODE_879_length_1795_cov_21.205036_g823_i0.p1  ORF type:complete len:567 (-),score=154.21 NODE_879_length_1795_cov_21.205036_g823_i0:93-1760(-)